MKRTGALRRKDYFRDPRARVVVHREVRQVPIPQHRHEFYEIVVILEGGGVHVTGDYRHLLEAGDVLVIDPRRAHGYEETRGLHLANVLVRGDVVPRLERELGRLPGFHALFTLAAAGWRRDGYSNRVRLDAAGLRQAAAWVDRIEEESARGAEGGHFLAEACLTLLVGLLARQHRVVAPPGAPRRAPVFGRLFSWIELHLGEDVPVSRLAQEAGMTVRTFHRRFREAAGRSPVDYVLERRLLRAAELLRHAPERGVAGVASDCGFADPNYFSRVFRARLGCTPREVRAGRAVVSPGVGRTRRGGGRREFRVGR